MLVVCLLGAACSRPSFLGASSSPASDTPPAPAPPPVVVVAPPPSGIPSVVAFPGAEGFGAASRGGRGGAVCAVTTLAQSGPGSLAACLAKSGPRIVVFRVSGVIEGPLEIAHGHVTIAGQTSPGGITIKGGLVCDNVYDANDCSHVIIRHVRFRAGNPDGLRLGGTHHVIVDHASFANAEDESIEITRSHDVTVQWSVVAEPAGDHYKWGGVLLNYATDAMPLDAITIHHTVWNGVAGRLPEISCEENGDGRGKSACSGRTLRLQLVNDVAFDALDPVWYNRCTGNNEGNDCAPSAKSFKVALDLVGNLLYRRSDGDRDAGLIHPAIFSTPGNRVFASDNHVFAGTREVASGVPVSAAPNGFPKIAVTPAAALLATLAKHAGAFPRDAMDARLAGYLGAPVDARPPSWANERGLTRGDALATGKNAMPPPVDTDGDGMPDAWERAHGLDPMRDDAADYGFADRGGKTVPGCVRGYTAIECYVNELATIITR
jgi:pectate lyase